MRFLTILILGVALLTGNPQLQAHQVSLEYDTELQTNFRGDYNWVNLLRLNGELNLSRNLKLQVSTISIAKTSAERLIDDLQVFSNIEEENLSLGIALLGAEYSLSNSTFFLGIRNVNEDYFTSPVTSLFVNSSCGIFPTISANCDIANYPLSSWCLHYKYESDRVIVQTSLYDGLGHRRIAGHDNIFGFSPHKNGIFSITSAEYDNNGSNYSLGCGMYYGNHTSDDDGVEANASASPASSGEEASDTPKKFSVAPWLNVEQRLTDECHLMLQASLSTAKTACRYYFGAGMDYKIGAAQFGLFADYAHFSHCSEIATELTCLVEITSALSIQPALEVIRTGSRTNVVGLARLSIRL